MQETAAPAVEVKTASGVRLDDAIDAFERDTEIVITQSPGNDLLLAILGLCQKSTTPSKLGLAMLHLRKDFSMHKEAIDNLSRALRRGVCRKPRGDTWPEIQTDKDGTSTLRLMVYRFGQ